MRSEYKLSRPTSIQGMAQREILKRFGDGRPFRWKDVRDAYKRAYKVVKGKDLGHDPTLGVTEVFKATPWIIHHQDSREHYNNGFIYHYKGIWHTVVSEDEIRACRHAEERGLTTDTGTVYYYEDPYSPRCAYCHKLHPNPINVQRIGRYEVF